MKTVRMMVVAGLFFVAGAVMAAGDEVRDGDSGRQAPPPERMEMRHPREGMNMAGNWVSKLLLQDENLDSLGLDGDARKKLVEGLSDISAKMKDLQKKIRVAGMEQGKLMREAMETPGADMAPVFAKVKEIGDMRTEQSLLSTKVFVVIRDNLTKEQHKKVRELVMKEGRQRMQARREFNGNMERRRPHFGDMEGPRRGRFRDRPEGQPQQDAPEGESSKAVIEKTPAEEKPAEK